MCLCLLPSLRLRTRTLTPICSKRFVRFVETNWMVLGAGTHKLIHHIRGEATPDEKALGSFTRRKLKELSVWDLRLASKCQRSSEVEHIWHTMSCPTWRHGVAFPTSLAALKHIPHASNSGACICSLFCLRPYVSS
jgi:hypothetical protein